jgi:hypothetical protein
VIENSSLETMKAKGSGSTFFKYQQGWERLEFSIQDSITCKDFL